MCKKQLANYSRTLFSIKMIQFSIDTHVSGYCETQLPIEILPEVVVRQQWKALTSQPPKNPQTAAKQQTQTHGNSDISDNINVHAPLPIRIRFLRWLCQESNKKNCSPPPSNRNDMSHHPEHFRIIYQPETTSLKIWGLGSALPGQPLWGYLPFSSDCRTLGRSLQEKLCC